MVQRWGYEQYDTGISEDADGGYVEFEDYEKLRAENARLKEEVKAAKRFGELQTETVQLVHTEKSSALQAIEAYKQLLRKAEYDLAKSKRELQQAQARIAALEGLMGTAESGLLEAMAKLKKMIAAIEAEPGTHVKKEWILLLLGTEEKAGVE